MNCEGFRDRLDEFADGLFPAEEAGRYAAHAASCAECQAITDESAQLRELLEADGAAALEQWQAGRMARRAVAKARAAADEAQHGPAVPAAATAQPGPRLTAGQLAARAAAANMVAKRPWWRSPTIPLAAAAVLVAGLGLFATGFVGFNGAPQFIELAQGAPARLEPGQQAENGRGRTISAEGGTVNLEVIADTERSVVRVESGPALFRTEYGVDLSVETPRGRADASGATVLIDVRSDETVAITVLAGRSKFDTGYETTVVRRGDQLEVLRDGSHIVSAAELRAVERENDRQQAEIDRLQAQLERAEEQMVAYSEAKRRLDGTEPGSGTVDWEGLGRAAWVLMDRSISYNDPRHATARAAFLLQAEPLREATGEVDMWRQLAHPVFLDRISETLMGEMAPGADEESLRYVLGVIQEVTDEVTEIDRRSPLPAERKSVRQAGFIRMVRAVQDELGVQVAADFVDGLSRSWSSIEPRTWRNDEHTAGRLSEYWTGHFELDVTQQSGAQSLLERYVRVTIVTQDELTHTLPPAEVEKVLFPSRRSRWGGSRSRGGDRSERSEEPKVEEPAAQRIERTMRSMEARLRLTEPRVEFERGMWDLLREDQRERGFPRSASILSFPAR